MKTIENIIHIIKTSYLFTPSIEITLNSQYSEKRTTCLTPCILIDTRAGLSTREAICLPILFIKKGGGSSDCAAWSSCPCCSLPVKEHFGSFFSPFDWRSYNEEHPPAPEENDNGSSDEEPCPGNWVPCTSLGKVGHEPAPVASIPTRETSPGGTSNLPYRPVGFVNHGTIAARVMAWTYIPQGSATEAPPSDTSTISFPPNVPGLWPNPSRFLSLPLGKYTWCYEWRIGDINGDTITEWSHWLDPRPVTLDATDSEDPDMAVQVDIDIPPDTDILPDLCPIGEVGGRPAIGEEATTTPEFEIRDFIVAQGGSLEDYGPFMIGLVHLGDQVELKGPITIRLRVHQHDANSNEEIPVSDEEITIANAETWSYYLDEASSGHPGNWDASIELISVNQ
jgi:hypothetical protein